MGMKARAGTLILSDEKKPGNLRSALRTFRLEWPLLIVTLILSDFLLNYLALRAAYWVRYSSGWSLVSLWTEPTIDYFNFSLLILPVWLAIFAMVGLYSRANLIGGIREYSLVFNATTLGMFVNISANFLFPDDLVLARGWVVMAWLFSFFSISAGRFLIRRVVYRLRVEGWFQSDTLIVGSNAEAWMVADQLLNAKASGLRLAGYIRCENCTDRIIDLLSCYGSLEDLDDVVKKHRIRTIILISSALSQEQVIAIFRRYGTSNTIDLRMSTGLYEIITTGLQVKEDGMVPLVVINKVRLTGIDQLLKTVLDYALVIPALLLLWPVFLAIAIAIKLDSPGPVIYLRRVMGVNGKQFNAFKFRTMRQDSDTILASHPEWMKEYQANFKLKDDPRVTRLGKFLRKTSLDELPQLVNVLRNEMSLVGPRMICPDELEKYDQWDINLLTVKPGLTGLWQVRGRSDVSYEERVRFDMFYIRNWSFWTDVQIIFQTIPTILIRRGAY